MSWDRCPLTWDRSTLSGIYLGNLLKLLWIWRLFWSVLAYQWAMFTSRSREDVYAWLSWFTIVWISISHLFEAGHTGRRNGSTIALVQWPRKGINTYELLHATLTSCQSPLVFLLRFVWSPVNRKQVNDRNTGIQRPPYQAVIVAICHRRIWLVLASSLMSVTKHIHRNSIIANKS